MTVQEQIATLESRVQAMIELVRRLKKEKTQLEAAVAQGEKEAHQLCGERDEVRRRVEKLLDVLIQSDDEAAAP
jgi:septal ring factor EnvC (AmiA/AmiB activator)